MEIRSLAGLVRAGQATGVHGVPVRWLGSSEQAGGLEFWSMAGLVRAGRGTRTVSHLICFTF